MEHATASFCIRSRSKTFERFGYGDDDDDDVDDDGGDDDVDDDDDDDGDDDVDDDNIHIGTVYTHGVQGFLF